MTEKDNWEKEAVEEFQEMVGRNQREKENTTVGD